MTKLLTNIHKNVQLSRVLTQDSVLSSQSTALVLSVLPFSDCLASPTLHHLFSFT